MDLEVSMLALISGLFAQLFGNSAIFYFALKTVLVTLLMTILPIILRNFFTWIVSGALSIVSSTGLGSRSPLLLALTGLVGHLASSLGLPGCFSVILSGVATRFTLRLIPFVRL